MSVVVVLDPKTVVHHIARVQVGDLEVTYDLMDLLDELQSVRDGFFGTVVIHDNSEGKRLEAAGLARRSNRGGYHSGPKLDAWLVEHSDAVYAGLQESHSRAYQNKE